MSTPTDGPVAMADIARLAGVSESTVSRALNNNPAINAHTRARIHQLAHKLNYKMNLSARNLRLQKSYTIAVVINTEIMTGQTFSDPFMMELISHLADELNHNGYNLMFASTALDHKEWHTHLIASRRADGVIVLGAGKTDAAIRALHSAGDPLVVWGAGPSQPDYCIVGSDNSQGGYLATEHLLNQGCQRIAFVGDTQHPEIAHRLEGHQQALAQAGQCPVDDKALLKSFRFDSVEQRLAALLQHGPLPFDGLFAASDRLAMEAIKYLQNRDLDIPQDVRVVGFDDIPMASWLTPALTTVRQNKRHSAQALVKAVLAQVNGAPYEPAVLPVELVVRES